MMGLGNGGVDCSVCAIVLLDLQDLRTDLRS
jgi:hypothetical protein